MASTSDLHESLARVQTGKSSSDRGFGLVFAVVFTIVALWPLTGDGGVRLWSLAVAGLFCGFALLKPAVLAPLNRLWFRFGMLLQKVVSPLILGLLFFAVFTPLGALMRLTGRDPLHRRWEPDSATYWIDREPPGPDPKTMPKQF